MNDVELEVFRADTRASRGITTERLASVAAFDCVANPIPVVIGHPKSDSPAEGTIAGFRLDGSKLFAKLKGVSQRVVDGIKSGSILNRSMAFFGEDHEANPTPGKLAPRHLGLLGGSAPGIPGMPALSKALAFAADDEPGDNLLVEGEPAAAIVFEAEPTATLTIFEAKEPAMSGITSTTGLTAEQLDAREAAATAKEKAAADRIRNAFEASNSAAIDALVRGGKVLPAEADDLKAAFNAFDPEAEELTFGAGDKATKATAASKLLTFMATAILPRVPLGGRQSPSHEFDAGPDKTASTSAQAGDLTAKARKLMEGNPSLSFEAAIEEVSGGGSVD